MSAFQEGKNQAHGTPAVGIDLAPRLLRSLALVLFLACGLCAAPYVAGLHEFGHWHAQDEPEHVHEIDATLVNPILTTRTVAVYSFPSQPSHPPLPVDETAQLEVRAAAHTIRAPPSA